MSTEPIEMLYPKIFPALDMVVFERKKKGVFDVASEVPEWYIRLHPDVEHRSDGHVLGLVFPFLGNFMVDADKVWQTHDERKLRSGPWVETDEKGNQYYLEAIAISLRNHRLLFIESLGSEFAERQALIQRARERTLAYHEVLRKISDSDEVLHHLLLEIGKPVSKLQNYLALLQREALSPSGIDFLKLCREQAETLAGVVDKMLEQSAEPDA